MAATNAATEAKPLSALRHPVLRWLITLLLPVLLVAWVAWAVGWGPLLSAWTSMPADTLALAVALVALSYIARAVRIYDYFIEETRGQFPATLRLSLLHNTANNLLPMRAGEAAFPLLMKRYFGQSLARSGLSLFWIRLLDLHLVGLVALIALYLDRRTPLYLALPVLWIGGLAVAHLARGWLWGVLADRPGRIAGLVRSALAEMPQEPARIIRIWSWTALSWGFKFVAFALVVGHFINIPLWESLIGIVGAELSSVLPIHGVAGAGSYEAAMTIALLPLGVSQSAALTAAVNLHLFLLGCTVLLGGLGWFIPAPQRRTPST